MKMNRSSIDQIPTPEPGGSPARLVELGDALVGIANRPTSPAESKITREMLDQIIIDKVGPPRESRELASPAPPDAVSSREKFEQQLYGHILSADEVEARLTRMRSELGSTFGLSEEGIDSYLGDSYELLADKRAKEQLH